MTHLRRRPVDSATVIDGSRAALALLLFLDVVMVHRAEPATVDIQRTYVVRRTAAAFLPPRRIVYTLQIRHTPVRLFNGIELIHKWVVIDPRVAGTGASKGGLPPRFGPSPALAVARFLQPR